MRGKCPARHVKTYIHPAPLGLTDIVKIGKRFKDAPIWEIAERKLAQGIVDWNSCLVFDIMFCAPELSTAIRLKGFACIWHISMYLRQFPLNFSQKGTCKRPKVEFVDDGGVLRTFASYNLSFSYLVVVYQKYLQRWSAKRQISADRDWWHHIMGQIPQDGEKEQNVFFFIFEAVLWPNGLICF